MWWDYLYCLDFLFHWFEFHQKITIKLNCSSSYICPRNGNTFVKSLTEVTIARLVWWCRSLSPSNQDWTSKRLHQTCRPPLGCQLQQNPLKNKYLSDNNNCNKSKATKNTRHQIAEYLMRGKVKLRFVLHPRVCINKTLLRVN